MGATSRCGRGLALDVTHNLCRAPSAWLASRHGGVACATFTLARASALQCLFPTKRGDDARAGRRGLPVRESGAARRAGGQGRRACEPESKVTAPCGHPVANDVSSPSLGSTRPWPPSTERSRAEAAGRSRPRTLSEPATPAASRRTHLRATPLPRKPLRSREAPAPQACPSRMKRSRPAGVDPATARRMTGGVNVHMASRTVARVSTVPSMDSPGRRARRCVRATCG